MSQKYFTTLTNIGAALHANAQLQQTTVPWTHLVLGDGNGVEPVPSPAQTGVIHEVDRLAISSIAPDPDNPNWIVIEAVIPADRGGYVVREAALYGGAGGAACIAVGNYPPTTKPLLSEGAGSELIIRIVVEMAHTATVTLKIDPAVVIASRDWVEKLHASQERRGIVELATPAEALALSDHQRVITPHTLNRVLGATLAETGMVVFSDVGTYVWEVPEVLRSGKKKPYVIVVGAGGGCPKFTALSRGAAGGGAAEGLIDLTGVSTVSITVGLGSTGTGGASSFGSYLSATGGSAGEAGVGTFSSGGNGIGGAGILLRAGGPGGGPDGVFNGEGGASPYSVGVPRSVSGIGGSWPGGGAGAGSTANVGANGAVIIQD